MQNKIIILRSSCKLNGREAPGESRPGICWWTSRSTKEHFYNTPPPPLLVLLCPARHCDELICSSLNNQMFDCFLLISLTCVDQRTQQKWVEEEVDSHHTVHLCQSCSKSCSVFLNCSIINVPVFVRKGNVGVLDSMENHVKDVWLSHMSGCQKLSDEDSRDVEEEDDPKYEESFSEVKSSVDCVGRRNWIVRIFITPPDSSFCQ